MGTSNDHLARVIELEQQMQDVTRRLAAMEEATASPRTAPGPGKGERVARPRESGDEGPDPRADQPGAETTVRYWGSGQFGPFRLGLGQRMTLSQVLAVPPESVAPVFAGLSSPARIALLYALIDGPRTSQQLREVLDAPSVGQLYHHLRELLAAGLIVQPARSLYQIPPGKIVAVCVAVLVADQLMSASRQSAPLVVSGDAGPPKAKAKP
jgi:DNA-binding transcriptional ArsR family regulator